jgi:hypothetical protein
MSSKKSTIPSSWWAERQKIIIPKTKDKKEMEEVIQEDRKMGSQSIIPTESMGVMVQTQQPPMPTINLSYVGNGICISQMCH